MTDPELTRQEFHAEVTELAKNAIREYCVSDSGEVSYESYAAIEVALESDLVTEYPISVEQYGEGSFNSDDIKDLRSSDPQGAIEKSRETLLIGAVDARVEELIDGGWDAISQETTVEKTTTTRTVFSE